MTTWIERDSDVVLFVATADLVEVFVGLVDVDFFAGLVGLVASANLAFFPVVTRALSCASSLFLLTMANRVVKVDDVLELEYLVEKSRKFPKLEMRLAWHERGRR